MWNDEKSAELVKTYKTTNFDVDQTAKAMGISVPQARGKLVALGAYRKAAVSTKGPRQLINKAQYVASIETVLGLKRGDLESIEKNASAKSIKLLTDALIKLGDKA
tara:strand:+ start:2428 stop:2745 length:318 start_codon:yes stop_codon:yes gene_type:complete